CSQPCARSGSPEPCVASCGDSRAAVFPLPVVLTFPGPALGTCSRESVVGASLPTLLGAPIPSGSEESRGMGGSFGSGGSFGYGGSSG
ncbi:KRSC protein, partial [Gymnorhina tibicen]|nr:KRSC protein [Gymnorhina tibicen]